jgi:glycosyltransferase involved in cell wall biosynthesis
MRDRLGIPTWSQVIGVFASFKPQKNHSMLLHAFRKVLDHRPDTQLLLVGDQLYGNMNGTKEYHGKLEALIEELGIRRRCAFLGNRDDVEYLYPACDVTALASLYEGTPNVLLESMACGVPVVATAVSDNAYVVPEGRAGHTVPMGDPDAFAARICDLLSNGAARSEMGVRARKWVEEEFSLTRLVEKTAAAYVKALERTWLSGRGNS